MGSSDINHDEEIQTFLEHQRDGRYRSRGPHTGVWKVYLPWALMIMSWTLSSYLWLSSPPSVHGPFETDFKDAHKAVAYEERIFTGKLAWNEDRQVIYRDIPFDEPRYFGEPSPSIDEAWKDLLNLEFPAMNAEEAAQFQPNLERFKTGYHFEPDVFHSLHCLNAIRMRIDKHYYEQSGHALHHENVTRLLTQDDWERVHIDHCLDQIKQSIQCHGDLSPVPLYSWAGLRVAIGIGQSHTCRKWEPIRKWMDQRNELRDSLGEYDDGHENNGHRV